MSAFIDRIGEVYFFKDKTNMRIIEYFGFKNITVQFEDGTIIKNRFYGCFKKGAIKNLNKPSIGGVGFIGFGKYNFKEHKKAYYKWSDMILRSCNNRFKSKNKTYKDCSVHPDWHNFQNFAKWYEENYIEGFQLDKDLLVKGNKMYSDKTCCFIPQEINLLISSSRVKKSSCPVGVFKGKKSYVSYLHLEGKRKHLGSFDNEIDAYEVYKTYKEKEIKRVANKYAHKISKKCYDVLINYSLNVND